MSIIKSELKKLWKETFNDTDAYIDLFFQNIDIETNVLYYEKAGKIISVLYMLPYEMTSKEKIFPVTYICGVATTPEERGKGLMNSLMKTAHEQIKKEGSAFSILIPASPELFTYYEKMGYSTRFYYETSHPACFPRGNEDLPGNLQLPTHIPVPDLFDFFDRQLRKRTIGILHNYRDFLRILQDLKLSGGELKILSNNDEIQGMAFIYPDEKKDHLLIKELLYKGENEKTALLKFLCKESPKKKYTIRQPAKKTGQAIPFGMVFPTGNIELLPTHQTPGFMSLMLE